MMTVKWTLLWRSSIWKVFIFKIFQVIVFDVLTVFWSISDESDESDESGNSGISQSDLRSNIASDNATTGTIPKTLSTQNPNSTSTTNCVDEGTCLFLSINLKILSFRFLYG